MDAIALVEQARDAGLKLSAIDGRLVLKGPRRLSSLVVLIAQNKAFVLAALTAPQEIQSQLSTGVGITETPVTPEKEQGFADSATTSRQAGRRRQPVVSPTPPPEIIADPVILCPRCKSGRVLAELRKLTGGTCYQCWEATNERK